MNGLIHQDIDELLSNLSEYEKDKMINDIKNQGIDYSISYKISNESIKVIDQALSLEVQDKIKKNGSFNESDITMNTFILLGLRNNLFTIPNLIDKLNMPVNHNVVLTEDIVSQAPLLHMSGLSTDQIMNKFIEQGHYSTIEPLQNEEFRYIQKDSFDALQAIGVINDAKNKTLGQDTIKPNFSYLVQATKKEVEPKEEIEKRDGYNP